MRSLLIWVAVLLLGGAALIELIDSDPGYVLISIWQTRIELSFWLAIIILLASGCAVALVLSVVRSSLQSTNSILGRLFNGSARRSAKQTSQGLLDFLEGNWKKSQKNLLKGAKKS
jgi:HemY protein